MNIAGGVVPSIEAYDQARKNDFIIYSDTDMINKKRIYTCHSTVKALFLAFKLHGSFFVTIRSLGIYIHVGLANFSGFNSLT